MLEGIYRSSGVKSKVNKLRVAFNSRTCSGVNLNDYEPAVVASVLKLVNLVVLCLLPTPYLLSGICLLILLLCFSQLWLWCTLNLIRKILDSDISLNIEPNYFIEKMILFLKKVFILRPQNSKGVTPELYTNHLIQNLNILHSTFSKNFSVLGHR